MRCVVLAVYVGVFVVVGFFSLKETTVCHPPILISSPLLSPLFPSLRSSLECKDLKKQAKKKATIAIHDDVAH